MKNIRLQFFLRLLRMVSVLSAIAYLSACVSLLLWQNRLLYHPSRVIKTTPASAHLRYQDVWVTVPINSGKTEQMHSWWIPSSKPETGVILYLHGKGSNISSYVALVNYLHQLGFSVLLIDYRGYGRSEGSFPTESSIYQDAQAAWNYLTQERQVNPKQIFL